jgi:glycosyltransferase involved in cell wall biosynthesis
MSGIATHALRAVRRRFGASIWIERGSRHILSQKRIMEQLPTPVMLSDFTVGRELLDYDAADTLVVPSRHVSESFAEYGVAKSKLFQNPYGVDLRMFPPTAVSGDTPPTILSVGTWCYRKGCDQLLAAWRLLPGVRLLHVGAVGDLALPSDPGFLHVDPVPQWQLSNFYAQAHVFALPSREEGLAVVQAQALASGLHLVCSGFSGGEDYSGLFPGSNRIRVCSMDAPQELAHLLQLSLADAQLETGVRESSAQMRAHLSWSAYGKRYSEELALRVTRN